jgi:hypothetical protein
MQSEIENQVRPLVQQAIDFEVQRFGEQAAIDERDLRACLEQIDQCLSAGIQRPMSTDANTRNLRVSVDD